MSRPLSLAIVQQSAVYLDLAASMELAERLIRSCSAREARLIIFGECWLTGYPAWIDHATDYARWDDPVTKEVYQAMHASSVTIPGPEIKRLQALCRDLSVSICMGCNEIDDPSSGTIYNSVFIIDEAGSLVFHHRKLMPTYTEKLLYGLGDGRGMHAAEIPAGRIGALICWEHWMPLLRQAMHNSVEDIHIALWPQVHERLQIASRHYAFEGRCFVVAAGQLIDRSCVPAGIALKEQEGFLLNGGSCVIGPDGNYLLAPQYNGPDIVYYEIEDLDVVFAERMTLDTSGHYQRPDLFDFKIRNDSK
ncbi:MAG: carbon-nitrogen hydrolase family protein [Saprospiraceae bacterium]|nr:carbon-nitrogen hydrolase family protein [Saprospiraceae bacterium]